MPRIAIRTDASVGIGSGHAMRSAALAAGLRGRGCDVTFYVRPRDGDMRDAIASQGFRVVALDPPTDESWLGTTWREDADQMLGALARSGDADAIVVDHYGLDARWESTMRPRRVVAVDDLADRPHDCDILIDQNVGADVGDRYAKLVPGSARLLLGPRFALLREQFRRAGAPRARDGGIERLLVFMGGFDASDQTGKVVRALTGMRHRPATQVVLSPRAPHAAAVARACDAAGIEYLGAVDAMADLLDRTDLAIGAAGTATLERAALGVPAVLVVVAENQRAVARACVAAGIAVSLGEAGDVDEARIAGCVEALMAAPERVAGMSAAARSSMGTDPARLGTDAVADAMLEEVL